MKIENVDVYNIENAMRGLRHPMESYEKSDTKWYDDTATNEHLCDYSFIEYDYDNLRFLGIGPKDMDLAQRMIKAGEPNDKYLRQIFVSMDITAPLFFWKEMDQYKIGTTTNSTSTMHKLATTPITLDCFEIDDFDIAAAFINHSPETNPTGIINYLEKLRLKYLETKDIRYWKELIRWLPESWLQTRTWTANYAVLRHIIHWRKDHKLSEWRDFVEYLHVLPYADQLLFFEN